MERGIQGRTAGFGPGRVIEKWLNAYDAGDVNRLDDLDAWRKGDYGWVQTAPRPGKYLAHVKSLVNHWPHLQLLADFMDVGTTPVRWNSSVPGGYPEDNKERMLQRSERMARTRVSVLEYPVNPSDKITKTEFAASDHLSEHISELTRLEATETSATNLRLFVVEDLSREVIETLGSHYDVDPSFFREHLLDYIWYNIKDWWREAPNLDIVSRGQNWFQMRFLRCRYFSDQESFVKGENEARQFNVYRPLGGDFNQSNLWDSNKDRHGKPTGAKVGHLRSRVTFWMKTPTPVFGEDAQKLHKPTIGIMLLDPTIREGNPVWKQYRNWNRVPTMRESIENKPSLPNESVVAQRDFFDDFIYWSTRPESFAFSSESRDPSQAPDQQHTDKPSPVCIPTQAILYLIGTEWLTLVDYIKTRLNQIDWEIAQPESFLTRDEDIDKELGKLHYWRRVMPVYRTMLADTFLRVFGEAQLADRPNVDRGNHILAVLHERGQGDRSSTLTASTHGSSRAPSSTLDELMSRDCINAYKQDYTLILNSFEEYQSRIDQLTEVFTAVISLQASRRGYKDNKNLRWLTWLATVFIPLSFVATMLSMTTSPLNDLQDAVVMWAEVSIPSAVVIMCVVLLMSTAKGRRIIRATASWFSRV